MLVSAPTIHAADQFPILLYCLWRIQSTAFTSKIVFSQLWQIAYQSFFPRIGLSTALFRQGRHKKSLLMQAVEILSMGCFFWLLARSLLTTAASDAKQEQEIDIGGIIQICYPIAYF